MSSPGLTVTVAVAPLPLLLAEPQSTLVSVQPLVVPSVTDLEPTRAAEGEALLVGLVASAALVSRLKLGSTPEPAPCTGRSPSRSWPGR